MNQPSILQGNILIASAQPANLEPWASLLARQGHRVQRAPSGVLVLDIARQALPDLILLDSSLPNRESCEMVELLKADERTRDIPIIAMVAQADALDLARLFAAGVADYLTIPFQDVQILARLRPHLELRVMRQQLAEIGSQLEQVISERAQIEKALGEAEEKGHDLLETLSDVIYTADANGLLTYLSPPIERLLGYRPSELIGRHIGEFIHQEDLAELGEHLRRVLGGHYTAGEYRAVTRDGEIRWMHTSSQPLFESGRIIGAQGVLMDITQQKQAEEQLRQQNKFLTNVLESLTHPFYVLDAHDYTVRIANSAARLGSRAGQSTCYALTHRRDTPCDTASHPCPLEEIKRTRAPVTVEHTHYDEQGNARNVEVHGYPLFDQEGNVVQAIEYSLDITERKKAEEALRESEARWRSVTENSPDHVILLDTDLRIRFLNYASPGLTVEELIGTPLYTLVAKQHQPEIRRILEDVLATAEPASYETEYQTPEGDTVYYESRVVCRIRDHQIVGLAVNARDITRNKRADEALRQSEKRYRQLLNTLQEGIWAIDGEARTTFVNPRMAQMLGYTVEEMQNQPLFSFMDERGVEIAKRNLERRASGIHEQHDFEFLHKDGSRLYASLETSPIYDDHGGYVGAIAGIQDITARKQAEEALKRSEALLRETQQIARVGGWELDLETHRVVWTEEVYRIHEVPFNFQPRLESALSFYLPGDRQILEDAVGRAADTGEPWDLELQFCTATGRRLWVRAMGQAECQAGRPLRLSGTFQDITERKQAEQALREAKEAAEQARREEAERRRDADRRRRIAESLADVLAALNSAQPLVQVLDFVAQQARQLLDSLAVAICQLQGGDGTLTVQAAHGLSTRYVDGTDPLPGLETLLQAIASRQHVAGSDLSVALPDDVASVHDSALCRATLAMPVVVKDEVYGGILLYYEQPRLFSADEVDLAALFGQQIALAIENARLREEVKRAAVTAERSRLARDLHDSVTQALFSASLVAEVLPQVWRRDPEEAQQGLEELRHLTRGALAEMRTLLLELRPAVVVETRLEDLLRQLTEATTGRVQIRTLLDLEPSPTLPPDVHLTFYRVAQEALHNAVKHAAASQVAVSLQVSPPVDPECIVNWHGQVVLRVSDNGQGFNLDRARPDQLGLGIMRERAASAGVELTIESQLDQGTEVALIWQSPCAS